MNVVARALMTTPRVKEIAKTGEPGPGHFLPAGQLLGIEKCERLRQVRFAMMPGSVPGRRLAVLAVVIGEGTAARRRRGSRIRVTAGTMMMAWMRPAQ